MDVAAHAILQLVIYPAEFGPAAYAAIPALYVHECVCHAAAQQDKKDNLSTFAEGLTDWAAGFFFRQWVNLIDPELATAARQHGEALRQVLSQPTTAEGSARRIGHRAGDALRGWIEHTFDITPTEAEVKVAHLIVELDRTDRPLAVKDHFVSSLRQPFQPRFAEKLKGWMEGSVSGPDLL
jgi:hypothetical protein